MTSKQLAEIVGIVQALGLKCDTYCPFGNYDIVIEGIKNKFGGRAISRYTEAKKALANYSQKEKNNGRSNL